MEDQQDRTNVVNDKNLEWFQLMGSMGITAACYPFEYVKLLIQIGHEPLPPKPTRTLLGRPALALPGVFTYMKHIRKVDGFWGLYRGLWPKICTNLINVSTYRIVHEKVPDIIIDREEILRAESEVTDEQKLKLEMNALLRSSVARCVTIVISHPFQVITIRTVAQFIGREEKYGGIFGSLIEIYQQDGILGYFSGLVPRILGEMFSLWLATIAASVINTYLVEEESLKSYVRASMCYLSNALFYPFQVVSNVSIVNNCGLKAGLPSNMPIYSNWLDCWSHLKAMGQLKRGSSTWLRYYNGPYASSMLSDPTGRRIERMYSAAASETSGRSIHDRVFRYNLM